ncbi:hypothetical protein OG417_03550 [Actinoallomurus sp. NBC_01490]|uniref:hypothetical protein n=1 Tax=Actinoallomurus sp. NBC_01490 TaxID=2903557 RepID=UPI002E2F883F|nr:hypothetical protein [Actinoallomurus sp. NBC_01490]
MSFGTYARKVRNGSLPYGRRVSAFSSCVEMYRPAGYEATWRVLEGLAGPIRRDEACLLRALEVLESSRGRWMEHLRAYAAVRREEKRHGRRSPRPGDPNPNRGPEHWYGVARQAAVRALEAWRRDRLPPLLTPPDRLTEQLGSCVAASLESGGPLTPGHRRALAGCLTELLRRRSDPGPWGNDRAAHHRVQDLLVVARLVEIAADAD